MAKLDIKTKPTRANVVKSNKISLVGVKKEGYKFKGTVEDFKQYINSNFTNKYL